MDVEHNAALTNGEVFYRSAIICADSGEWVGWEKSGIGIYNYPSKASYAGQWSNNLKDGYGIYSFPKGGLYKVKHPLIKQRRCNASFGWSSLTTRLAGRDNGFMGLWMVWASVCSAAAKSWAGCGEQDDSLSSWLFLTVQLLYMLQLAQPRLQKPIRWDFGLPLLFKFSNGS